MSHIHDSIQERRSKNNVEIRNDDIQKGRRTKMTTNKYNDTKNIERVAAAAGAGEPSSAASGASRHKESIVFSCNLPNFVNLNFHSI